MFAMLTIGGVLGGGAFANEPSADPDADRSAVPPPVTLEPIPDGEPGDDAFERDLEAAKVLYFEGEMKEAARALTDLWERMIQGEDPGPEARAEALIYLGEIRHKQQAFKATETVFRWLFEQDPDATISPFHHPPDVRNVFESVRRQVQLEQQQAKASSEDRGPPPVWTFLPLGIPQASQGRTGSALAFGGMQLAFVGTSLGLYVHLNTNDVGPTDHPSGWSKAERAQRVDLRTYALQWPSAALFYVTWGLSVRDGVRHWRRRDRTDTALVPLGPQATPGLTLTHRFGHRRSRALLDDR